MCINLRRMKRSELGRFVTLTVSRGEPYSVYVREGEQEAAFMLNQ